MPLGVGGAATRVLRAEPVAAWVETVRDRTLSPTLERVKAHDAVTETALLTGDTPLPARFGQVFESDEACAAALRARESRLVSDLAQVQGLVEMRVVVALILAHSEGIAGADSPGWAYMKRLLGLKAREERVKAAAESVRGEVGAYVGRLVRGETFTVKGEPAIVTLSHLIRRDHVAEYRAALHDATFTTATGTLVVRGPGAPYDFVSAPA